MPKGKGRGKTAFFTVRMEPKLRFALWLMARIKGQSMAAALEWAVRHAMQDPLAGLIEDKKASAGKKTRHDWFEEIWHPDEMERFLNLATKRPDLLNPSQELLWRGICGSPVYFDFKSKKPRLDMIRAEWEGIGQRFPQHFPLDV